MENKKQNTQQNRHSPQPQNKKKQRIKRTCEIWTAASTHTRAQHSWRKAKRNKTKLRTALLPQTAPVINDITMVEGKGALLWNKSQKTIQHTRKHLQKQKKLLCQHACKRNGRLQKRETKNTYTMHRREVQQSSGMQVIAKPKVNFEKEKKKKGAIHVHCEKAVVWIIFVFRKEQHPEEQQKLPEGRDSRQTHKKYRSSRKRRTNLATERVIAGEKRRKTISQES